METLTQTIHWLKSPVWEDMIAINQPEYNIAIWQRDTDELVGHFAFLLLNNEWPAIEGFGAVADIAAQLDNALKHVNGSAPASYSEFRKDILSLAEKFAELMPDTTYRWRLMKVNGNMCRLYHSDINDLRLLCTYHGPGTLWLPNDNIDKSALRKGLADNIAIDPARVEQVKTGEVALLKGALHPNSGNGPIIHRSPTIEEHGRVRLLFRMDTAGFGSL